jgi:phosphatidylserine/phosphatidylglycerophosphate/cardiolipin synthase-like enzyme
VRKSFLRLVCALALAGSLAGSLLVSAPATADKVHDHQHSRGHAPPHDQHRGPWAPTNGGFFNNPWGNRHAKFQIERQIIAAIRHAQKGSHIRIAVYSFDRVNVAKALLNAHKRGVRVQVLHNDHQYTTAMRMLKHGLGTNRGKKSWDYTCRTGCRSVQGVLHDKIYLFDHTGTATNVVMTGSANLTGNAAVHQFNDLLVKKGSPALHRTFLRLFWELMKDKTARPLYEHKRLENYQLWVMPHPHNTSQNDPVVRILRQVKCWGARGGTGNHGRTRIRVSMHSWNGDRGTFIARRLRHLYARGCDVRVLWALGGARMKQMFERKTRHGRVPRRADGYNTDCDALHQVDMYSHQKYMTISGWYGDDRSSSYVFTGSSNWTSSGISGDELILRAPGPRLVRDWNRNFSYIWHKRARSVSGNGGYQPGAPYCPYYRSMVTGLQFSGRHWEGD